MKVVNWSFLTSHEWDIDHTPCVKTLMNDYYPFGYLPKEVISIRQDAVFLRCPSHTDFLKNTYILQAPFDLTIEIDINERSHYKVVCENISQEVFEHLIDIRFLDDYNSETNIFPVIGIDWLTILTCDESMLLQVMPAFMHRNDFTEKTTLIPGEFDISKWTRPVEIVFEIKSNKEKIVIKKGDAIAYFKFHSNESVKLVEQPTPWGEIKLCNSIRQQNKFRPLKERYASLENERIKRCPYEQKN